MTIYVSDDFDTGTTFRTSDDSGRSDDNKWYVEQLGTNKASYSSAWAVNGSRCLSLWTEVDDWALAADEGNGVVRCDVATYTTPLFSAVAENEVWWWSHSFYLPSSWYQPVHAAEWNTIQLLHGNAGVSTHGLVIENAGKGLQFKVRPNGTYTLIKQIEDPVETQIGHHIKGRILWNSDTSPVAGEIEVWWRKEGAASWTKVVDAVPGGADGAVQTIRVAGDKYYLKIQNYHPDTNAYATTETTVYHDRIRVATTEAEVDFFVGRGSLSMR